MTVLIINLVPRAKHRVKLCFMTFVIDEIDFKQAGGTFLKTTGWPTNQL